MSGKNLTFKLVMDADTKGFVTNINQSTKSAKEAIAAIKDGTAQLVVEAKKVADSVDSIVPSETKQKVAQLVTELHSASKALDSMGSDADLSAENLKQMGDYGEQALQGLQNDLKQAKLHLNYLAATHATPEDIDRAQQEVKELETGVKQVKVAFQGLQSQTNQVLQEIEANAKEVQEVVAEIVPSQTQQRVSQLVTELNFASKSLDSMGHEANISAENLKQLGEYGEQALQGIQEDLKQAKQHLNYLSATNATPADIQNAQQEVKELEVGVKQVKTAFEAYKGSADIAINSIVELADEAQKSSNALSNIIPKGTNELADKLTQSLTAATGIIKDAGDNAKSTAGNFTDFGNKSHKALDQLKSDLVLARQNLESFSKTNAAPADIEKAKVQVDQLEKEVEQADQAFNAFQQEVDQANTSLKNTSSAGQTAQKGLDTAKFAVNALVGAMATLGVGLGIHELAQAADTYTNLSARIHIATKDGGDFTSAMAGVHQVALMTNSSLEATGSLFTRLNAVGKEMGMTQQNSLDLTKTINQAIKTSGGSAEASEAAVQQFIQAMQGGVLRGEEFNSIMEGGYGVAEALAKGLGVTTGELRKMAESGELSAERVYKALLSQKDAVQQTFDQFPTTIGNAIQRISTSWEILIGKMDQSNGASATVANWMVTIADNMDVVETLLADLGQGFVWVGDQLKKIDPATIEALKTALVSAYETLKSVGSTIGASFEATIDILNTALNAVFGFNTGIDEVNAKTSGFTKLLQALNVVIGFIGDGFSAIGIGVNLLTGAIYDVASAFTYWKSKLLLGDAKDQALKEYEELATKAQEYYTKASNGAIDFEFNGVKAVREISKTQKEKNAERIADNQQTLDQLKAQEEKHKADYKAISDERIKLEQQLFEARKTGNDAAIQLAVGNLTKLDAKEKEYQAESKKINEEKIKVAQDWVNAQLVAADGTQKAADLATQKTLQTTLAAQGLKAEFSTTGSVIVSAMDTGSVAVSNMDNALTKARQGATALGIDLDIALNRVSEKFNASQIQLNNFANGMGELGLKGKAATETLYLGWEKWLATAKSQVELDAAKAKLIEFGTSGQLSTQQVEMGMQAVKRAVQEIPASMSPVEAAFERLGIKTKEQLKLAADLAINDFNTIMKSGEATQDGLQKAYEETIRLAYASGNAQVIAAANYKAAYLGLEVQLDQTGKATVAKLGEIQQAAQATQQSVQQASRTEPSSSASGTESNDSLTSKDSWEDFKSRRAKINEATRARMDKSRPNRSVSAFSSSALGAPTAVTPQVDIANMAPMIASSFDIQGIETIQPTEKKVLELVSGGRSANLEGTPEAVDTVDQMLREFEMLKRGM